MLELSGLDLVMIDDGDTISVFHRECISDLQGMTSFKGVHTDCYVRYIQYPSVTLAS